MQLTPSHKTKHYTVTGLIDYHSGANVYSMCTFLNNGYFWTSCPYFVFEAIEYTCQFDTRFKRWTGHINSNEHQKNLTTFCIKKKFYFNQICFIFCTPGNTSGISSPCSKRVFQPKEERPTEWTPIHNKHLIEKQTKKLYSFIAKKAPTNVLAKRPCFLVLLLLQPERIVDKRFCPDGPAKCRRLHKTLHYTETIVN